MSNISADIKGIIRELSLSPSDFLTPLYEMVVNSIQAIEERKNSTHRGKIRIEIIRDKTQGSLFPNQSNYPIKSIIVTDDGIGFTKENYKSYSIAYSAKKQKLGGKGIGRFAALSVFSHISIDSIFESPKGNKRKVFELDADNGLSSPKETDTKNAIRTIVSLSSINTDFIKPSAKYSHEVIADSLLGHCVLFYINRTAPIIEIIEDDIIINLDNRFNPDDFVRQSTSLSIGQHEFSFFFVNTNKKQHSISYCANSRKVKGKKVTSILPIFSSAVVENSGEEAYYDIYIVSPYLDRLVNSARTDIQFPKEETEGRFEGTEYLPTEKDVEDLASQAIHQVFEEVISRRRSLVKTNVQSYIDSDEGIGYRYLHLEDDFYDNIPDDISEKKLSDILHEEEFKHSKKRRDALNKLNERAYSNTDEYRELLHNYLEISAGEGESKLGQYVAHRKVIIDLLQKYLEWNEENDNYEQEEVLHNLIYTMGGDHTTINYDFHNLWLLDDRLTFHKYIYSDRQIKSHTPVEGVSDCRKETDIAIYDTAYHYAEKDSYEEVKSVVIFELKRPNRNVTYFDFFKQMNEQIKGIESGSVKDNKGRNVRLPDNTPITFYFVCDTNAFNQIKTDATDEGYILTPYGSLMRVVGVKHVEILTYQTILVNARRRNKIFFDKLGISR